MVLYEEASKQYIPLETNLLFVGESPPVSLGRYFYFLKVLKHDYLWVGLMKSLYCGEFGDTKKERLRKEYWLNRFKNDGYRLIDAVKNPIPKVSVKRICEGTDDLIGEIRNISPRQILLIKVTVYDALYKPLQKAGLPVINARLPFPSSGRQIEFHDRIMKLVNDGKLTLTHPRG